jgi:TIR domain
MSGIFISYRREDSAPYAGRIYDRLCARFGAEHVFMDVDDILPGADFAEQIRAKISSSDAVVAVIGTNWPSARDEKGAPRLAEPNDFVRLELASALQLGRLIIPVLVDGAAMPQAQELPGDLRALAGRNAVRLQDHDFQRDFEIVLQALEKLPALTKLTKEAAGARAKAGRAALRRRLLWKAPVIMALMAFAVWWQWRQEQSMIVASGKASEETARIASAIAGQWEGEVTYSWGAIHKERFFFAPEGDKVFGTATFLGAKRGIEAGSIDAPQISFTVRFEESLGSTTRRVENFYTARVEAGVLTVRLQDNRGTPPVAFQLTRSLEAG